MNAATAKILYCSLAYMGLVETGRGDYFPDDGESTVNAEDFYGVWEVRQPGCVAVHPGRRHL